MTAEEIIIRILIATLCGTIIGYDRARKGRNAGTKTHALVAIGSALAMLVGEYITKKTGTGDPTRLASQVVSGIGFLGAGAIIVTGEKKIVGLTTAATLWVSAIVGISAGAGMYVGTLASMIGWGTTFTIVNFMDKKIFKNSTAVTLFLKLEKPTNKLELLEFLKTNNCEVVSFKKVNEDTDEENIKEFHYIGNLNLDFSAHKQTLKEELLAIKGVNYVNIVDDEI